MGGREVGLQISTNTHIIPLSLCCVVMEEEIRLRRNNVDSCWIEIDCSSMCLCCVMMEETIGDDIIPTVGSRKYGATCGNSGRPIREGIV
jgi:hypothetical protein